MLLLASIATVSVAGMSFGAEISVSTNGDAALFTATADDVVILDVSGFLASGKPADPARVANADIKVKNWNIINGYSPSTYTFNGALTKAEDAGADGGNITFNWNAGRNQIYNFNGDLSGYDGNFSINGQVTLNFGGDKATAESRESIAGTGSITVSANAFAAPVHFNVTSGTSTVTNSSINVVDLRFSSSTYDVSSSVVANALHVNAGSTANFSNTVTSSTSQNIAGTANFTNVASFSGASSITGTLAVGASGTVNLLGTTTNTGSITVAAGGTLNLSGTYTGSGTILNEGTLTFASDIFINLENMTSVDGVYTLFIGGTSESFASLTVDNLTGIVLSGYSVVFNANGTITTTLEAVEHTWTSATDITWQADTIFEADKVFASGDILNIESNATITLGADVTASQINVESGFNTTIDSAGHTLTVGTLSIAGGITLRGDLLTADTAVVSVGDTAQLVLELGAGMDANYAAQLKDYAGDITVQTGTLTYANAADLGNINTASDITVGAGATLSLAGGNAGFASVTLEDGSRLALNNMSGFSNALQATGDVTLYAHTAGSFVNRDIAGSGSITKTGGAKITISANQTHTGVLDITEGEVQLGTGDTIARAVAYSDIIVRDGATFTFNNGVTTFAHIQLDGGTFANNDASTNASTIAKLSVTKDSNITTNWNGNYAIAELTGTSNLNVSESATRTTDPFFLNVTTLKNFNGTLNMGNKDRLNLSIAAVDQAVGNHAIIADLHGGLTGENFSMTGAGTLELQTGLNMTGTVSQTGGGLVDLKHDATVGTLSISGGTTNVGSNLTVTNSANLAANSKVTATGYELLGQGASSTVSKVSADTNITLAQNAISNAVLTEATLTVSAGQILSLDNVSLSNSTLNLQEGTLDATNVSMANSQVQSTASSVGAQNLTLQGGATESVLVYTMTGFANDVSISDSLTLDVTLTAAMYDAFVAQYEAEGYIGFELENVLAGSITSATGDITVNIFDETGMLYGGSGLTITDIATSAAGNVTIVGVNYIPEPSTATLSLLALAGLLARRRRRA